MATADDLLGAWELRSWVVRTPETGEVVYPLGEDARGRIHYSADGYMTASIARPGRAVPMSVEDARRILRNYMHYTGRWQFADNVVTHVVDFAVDPALVGRKLARTVQITGDHLTLSGEDVSTRDGRRLVHVLEWQRAKN